MSSIRPNPQQIVGFALRRVRSFGAASVAEVASAALEEGIRLSSTQVREALAGAGARFLDDDWFLLPGGGRDGLSILTRRILAVTSPLELATVRAGIGRAHRRRFATLIPPAGVLQAFYESRPDFDLDSQGRVRPASQLDYRAELGTADRVFVEVLRSSWTGVLDRAAFREACTNRGMTRHVFGSSTIYSPILDHPAPDAWCLRGTRFSPIIVAALRHAKGAQARDD